MDYPGTWYKIPLPSGLLGYLKIEYAKLVNESCCANAVYPLLNYEDDIFNYDIINSEFEDFLNKLTHRVRLCETPNTMVLYIMFENQHDMMEFQLRFT